jgi:hypothetical protein
MVEISRILFALPNITLFLHSQQVFTALRVVTTAVELNEVKNLCEGLKILWEPELTLRPASLLWIGVICERWGEVALRLMVSRSICLGIKHPCRTCDQILLPVRMLLSEICSRVSVGRPLWQEDGSAVCSVMTQWSESRRIRNHLRLP